MVKFECGIFSTEFTGLKSPALLRGALYAQECFHSKGFTLGCPYALFSTELTVPVTHLKMQGTGQQHFKRKPWKTNTINDRVPQLWHFWEYWTNTSVTCRKFPGRSEVLSGNKNLTGEDSEAQSGSHKKQYSSGGMYFISFPLWHQLCELSLLSKFPGNYILKQIEHNVQVLKYLTRHFPFCLSRYLLFFWHCSDEHVMPLKYSGKQESWL